MNPFRLVLVTRQFWPRMGSDARATANLATELSKRGCRVTILTSQWQPEWPAKIHFRGIPVVRLPHPPHGGREAFRYVRSLARWFREHEDDFDLVYVSGLRHEAYAALRTLRGRVPVVLRAAAAGRRGDCLWQIEATCGRRIKRQCMKAAALVGSSRATQRELQAAGYPRERIHHIADGVPLPPPRSPAVKTAARAALAAANRSLDVPEWVPLAVYLGRLHPDKGLGHLVAAWKAIVARWPNARLWLAGAGPDRAALAGQIETLKLTGRVVPLGVFDEVDELLAAANLFVSPSHPSGTSLALLEAMAAGLPIVAGDGPGSRALIADGRDGLLVPPGEAASLSAAITRLLDQPDLAARLGSAARQRAANQFSLAKMVDQHVTLFERLVHSTANRAGLAPVEQE